MGKYKSKYINVEEAVRESYTTTIKFRNPTTKKLDEIIIRNIFIEDYFLNNYKHLGINATNVVDFLNRTDAKYKIELEDIEKFLDTYLYNVKCIVDSEQLSENLE